jgi:hypothetical protein
LHDLRRTAATGMARLNIAPHVVDRILNHVSGTICGAAAVYNRHAYTEERKMVQRSARWPSMCGAGISRVLFAQRRRMLSRSPAHASETDHSPLLRSAEAVRGGQKRYLRKTETHSVACAGISRGSFGHGAKRSRVCDNAKIERPAASPQRFRKDFVPRRS